MGLFNRKKSKVAYLDFDNINKEYDSLTKSFRNGKGVSATTLDNLGFNDSNNNDLVMNQSAVLKQKKFMNNLSNNTIVQAIIRTRTNQVLRFCKLARNSEDGVGFKIIPKDNSKGNKERIKELEETIYYTGKPSDYREWRDTFPSFITKLVNDLFVYDQVNIERVFESPCSKQLNHFNMVDAGSVVISDLPKSLDKPRKFRQYTDDLHYVDFTEKELTFITYWGSSDIHARGYGQSPVLSAATSIDYHNDTTNYNGRFFKQGGTTKGLLFLNTDGVQLSAESLESIKRAWGTNAGLNGAWKIPMISGIKDAKFINMQQNPGDYEFSGWLTYLINSICADFAIDPAEINFPNKGGGSTSSSSSSTLNEGNTARTHQKASQAKGLKPLLDFIERIINDYLMRYIDDDYQFIFTLGEEDEQNKVNIINSKLKNGMTINEARKQMGLSPLQGHLQEYGDLIGNADNIYQYISVQDKMDAQANEIQQHLNDGSKLQDGSNGKITGQAVDDKDNDESITDDKNDGLEKEG